MKKKLLLGAIICTLLALTACGSNDEKSEAAVEVSAEENVAEADPEPDHEVETDTSEETDDFMSDDENAISMEVYKKFIDSGESLYFDIYDMEGFEKDKAYSLKEFFETKKNNYNSALYKYYDPEYAFIDCGNDGVNELLIKYTFSGEPSETFGEGCDYYKFMDVVKYIDGKLEMCYENVSFGRVTNLINESGIVSGALVDYEENAVWTSESFVDKNGVSHQLFIKNTLYPSNFSDMYNALGDETYFSELFERCNELGVDVYVYATEIKNGSMKDQTIYSYELTGNEQYRDAIEEAFNKADVKLLQSDEYDDAIKSVIEEFGLTEETFYSGEPEFTAFSVKDDSKEPWKEAYEDYLFDLLTGKEYMHDSYEAYSIAGPDVSVLIAVDDITEDGIPELWVYSSYDDYVEGIILSYKDDSRICVNDAMNWYYNPESKVLYAHEGGYAEKFTAYKFENGSFAKDYELWQEDGYYLVKSDNTVEPISEDQANALISEFESGKAKYTLKPTEVNLGNVDGIMDQF